MESLTGEATITRQGLANSQLYLQSGKADGHKAQESVPYVKSSFVSGKPTLGQAEHIEDVFPSIYAFSPLVFQDTVFST